MELTRVRYEVEHHVAYITLNNPDYMNVFDEPTDKELMQCFAACEFDPEVHVVVFQAEGRAFSGGGDINSMIGELQKPAGESVLLEESFSWPAQIARQIRSIRKPVIAALQGAVAGVAAQSGSHVRFPHRRRKHEAGRGFRGDRPSNGWLRRVYSQQNAGAGSDRRTGLHRPPRKGGGSSASGIGH